MTQKFTWKLWALLGVVLGAGVIVPQSVTAQDNDALPTYATFVNPLSISIAADGTSATSEMIVQNLSSTVRDVRVTLNFVQAAPNDDLVLRLTAPNGQELWLLSATPVAFNGTMVIFQDSGFWVVNDSVLMGSVTLTPQIRYVNPCGEETLRLPEPENETFASHFADTDAAELNGTWTLTAQNWCGAENGAQPAEIRGGWVLEITTADSPLAPDLPAPPYAVPSLGELELKAGQVQPAYVAPGRGEVIRTGDGAEVLLPYDADASGYDTFTIAGMAKIEGNVWVGLYLGGPNWGWIPLKN